MNPLILQHPQPLRVRFARKPADLDDVLASTSDDDRPEPVVISETRELPTADYDQFARNLLQDRDWLAGKGGYPDHTTRHVVEVRAEGRQTLYVDPSGSAYGRYVGVADMESQSDQSDQANAIHWLLDSRRPEISLAQAIRTLRFALCSDPSALRILETLAAEHPVVSKND
jgi:hypothetical protein